VLRAERLGEGDVALLEVPAQSDLGGGLAVPGGGPGQGGLGQQIASSRKKKPIRPKARRCIMQRLQGVSHSVLSR